MAGSRHAGEPGVLQPRRVGAIREDANDLGGVSGVAGRFDQRRHVGAAAGNEDGDALLDRHRASLPSNVTGSPVRSVIRPMMAAFSPCATRWVTSASASVGAMT